MTTPLCMRNWGKWQSYRSDRGTPPWIKVHRVLFTNPEWAMLTDAEKGQLVSLWIVAADNGGCVPGDKRVLRKIAMLDDEPDVEKFIKLGFIEPRAKQADAKVTPPRQPDDAPETETETETEDKKNTAPPEGDEENTAAKPYKSKKGKLLKNGVLFSFNEFWKTFAYPKGKAEAADSFLTVFSPDIFQDILTGAKVEAENRSKIVSNGGTPKWAQGWLSGRRWEDGDGGCAGQDCSRCDYRVRGACKVDKKNCGSFVPVIT